ncbi:hypothetical protein Tco_0422735, partial [Tanacetum coccineum]
FNTIITSLKALDEGYSSKNYVRKFLRALHSKWRAKVAAIEESKDLTSLSLDELIGNLKVHEMIIKKASKIVQAKGERRFLALKAKKESSKENVRLPEVKTKSTPWRLETSRSSSREEEDSCGHPNHLIKECLKPPKEKNQRAFVGGSWSDSGEEDDEKDKDETCLMAQASSEVLRRLGSIFTSVYAAVQKLKKALGWSISSAWCCSRELRYCSKELRQRVKFKWTEKTVLVTEGSSETTTEGYMENYKNVSQDMRDQLNVEAEVVQIILKGIDNDIYSTFDACPNACKILENSHHGMVNHLNCSTQEWQGFVTLVKQSQELKTISYHKLYDILKQHQNEVNEIRAKRLARKAIVNSSAPIYNQEPATVTEDNEMSKEKEIDKLMALISLSFKKIYKPTNNNLRTSSNISRANQDNSPRINRGTRECQKPKRVKDAAYHKEKMLLCKQEEDGVQLNAEQADWKDDTDDESDDQELEAHYMYMAQIQEVTLDAAENSRPIFDAEPLHKVQNNNDNYNVFTIENAHPEQPESVNDIYLEEQDDTNITIDSLDMCYDREQDDQDDTDELDQEHDLLASLIDKLKCEIYDSKNCNKFLESSHKALVDKLKGEIEDFKTKNKSLESSNNHFKEANNELSKTNQLMFKDLKKFQAKLDKYHDVNYASKVEIDCAKAKGDLMSYKIEFEKSSNEYTRKINDLNQTISDMKKELVAHKETISIMSQEKEAQIKLYKTREYKELDKVIALENKVKVLDDIVYKTGQSVQTMNMLNRNCKTSFAKPGFLKKAQRANPRLYDIGCYNDNLALMLAPESDKTIRLDKNDDQN